MPQDENDLFYAVNWESLHDQVDIRLNGFFGREFGPDEYEQNRIYDFDNPELKVEEVQTVNGDNTKLNGMPLTVKGHVPLINNKTGRNCGKISIKLDISYDLDEEIVKS